MVRLGRNFSTLFFESSDFLLVSIAENSLQFLGSFYQLGEISPCCHCCNPHLDEHIYCNPRIYLFLMCL